MFVFLLILFTNSILALPVTTDGYIKGTTMGSNDLHESINTLQSAIDIIFPKKNQSENKFSIDRQSLLIGCLFKKIKTTEKQRRVCKGLHENNDKKVYYEFEDRSVGQNKTMKDIDYIPIHVEHINVARVKNNKEKSEDDTVEEIQKLTASKNRLINNKTFNQNLIYSSTPVNVSLNRMDVNEFKKDNRGGMYLWSSNNGTVDKMVDVLSKYYSSDSNFETDKILSKLNQKSK